MSTTAPLNDDPSRGKVAWARGITLFAGAMLLTVGVFHFLMGLSAALTDELYVSGPDYAYRLDINTWGWIHMVLGALAVGIAAAIIAGKTWAMVVAVLLVSLSAIANFMSLPWYPWWSLVVLAFDIAVLWALCTRIDLDNSLS